MKNQFCTILLSCACWLPLHATTFLVDNLADAGSGTLRQAILDANADLVPPHTINIQLAGTIFLLSPLPQLANDISINGNSAKIDAGTAFRIFEMGNSFTITLSDLTIQNGSDMMYGGCIYNEAFLTLIRCTVSGGVAGMQGGGIYHSTNLLSAFECNFLSNQAGGEGGGIYSLSNVVLRDCTFGALNSVVGSGGGIACSLGSVSAANCTFDGNHSDDSGSAVALLSEASGDFTNCTFTNNEVGAVFFSKFNSSFATLQNCTIAGNATTGLAANTTINLINTIIARNTIDIEDGTFIATNTTNLVENCAVNCPVFSLGVSPMLAGLSNNGGFTQTMALLSSSPAIDAGTSMGLLDDQRGQLRSGVPDIGAYEFASSSLPIGLLNFSVQRSSIDKVQLSWATSSEQNNKGFEVQRKFASEGSFKTLAWVAGHGTTNATQLYALADTNTFAGTSYYRLKQINTTGDFSYSSLKAVDGKSPKNEMALFPNPSSGDVYIRLDASLDGQFVKIELHSADGKLVSQSDVIIPDNQLLALSNVANLTTGVYTVQLTLLSGISYTRKFEKLGR